MHSTTLHATASEAVSESHIKYRRDIDGLRAIAVAAVLVFHAFPKGLVGGFIGVDVFFVISGFLITKVIATTLERGTFSIADFYARRVRRIFPALVLVLLTCLAFGWKTMLAEDLAQLAKHIFGGATFSSNLMLWQEAGYFDEASESKPLLHLWSLGIEEQFYIVWPLLMWWGWRNNVSPLKLIVATAAASFLVNTIGITRHPTATFYSPVSRAWELLMGAAMAYLAPISPGRGRESSRHVASILGVALIFATALFLKAGPKFPGWWALLPSMGACLVIWAGPEAVLNRVLLSSRAMVGIGLISFPLYLWHWPLLTFGRGLVPPGELGRAGLLLLAILLAWATYALVERPFRFGTRARAKIFGLSAVMLFVGVASAAIFVAGGVPARYPEIVQRATHVDLDSYQTAMRYRSCFLEIDQVSPEFGPQCIERGNKPLLMLWGDSGAGALYPGFRALADTSGSFRIGQFTSSGCPPILGLDVALRPACEPRNRTTLQAVRELKPDIVVLAAIWQYYDTTRLAATIDELKTAGARRVVLMGPGLVWNASPARIVLKLWQEDPLHKSPPIRLDYSKYGYYEALGQPAELWRTAAVVEPKLKAVAEAHGAEYVSVLGVLCNGVECLMRTQNDSGESIYFDTIHLNPIGAKFVVASIAPQIRIGTVPRQ